MTRFTCGGCGTLNIDRDACEACATASPTATIEGLVTTALNDATAARACQVEENARGNHELARHLGTVADSHLDEALALRRLSLSLN